MELSSSTPTGRVVAIANDGTWTHVYRTFETLLGHDDKEASPLGAMEFFDADGARLATVFDPNWRLVGLHPSGEPEPRRLRQSLQAVLHHAADYLQENPELAAELELPGDFEAQLRKLAEAELEAMLTALEVTNGAAMRPLHSAGYLHNLMHAAGWNH